jgi:rhodanese-related sulfurtransferase
MTLRRFSTIIVFASTAVLVAMLCVGCSGNSNTNSDSSSSSAETKKTEVSEYTMTEMTPADAQAKLTDSNTVFLDVRKASDFNTSHIEGAVNADMDKAKDGDNDNGIENMKKAISDNNLKNQDIILVCYSGKRYAQAATNILNYLGYDMSKVKTLEGGMKAWEAAGYSVHSH